MALAKPKIPPPDRHLVNVGAILERPFLHQLRMPLTLGSAVDATKLDDPVEGVTTFTFLGTQLLMDVYKNDGCEKTTEYHYTAVDPAETIAALNKKRVELQLKHDGMSAASDFDPLAQKAVAREIKKVDEAIKKITLESKKGPPPPRLVRLTFVEDTDGQVLVTGETTFEYDAGDIVKAKSVTQTDESPPRVDRLEKVYTYNDLGQVTQVDEGGAVTYFRYDPVGRMIQTDGDYLSQAEDYRAFHRTLYTYTPPGDPTMTPPPNSLLTSLNDSASGPMDEWAKTNLKPETMPPPIPGVVLDLPEDIDYTVASGTFAY
tara:strand:- start:134 stop:1084 length:951 start_codon:yes stop_codon:yes gene_type:complete